MKQARKLGNGQWDTHEKIQRDVAILLKMMNADAPSTIDPKSIIVKSQAKHEAEEPTMSSSCIARTHIPNCEDQRSQVEINLQS